MAAISWQKLAQRCGITEADITDLRANDDAPKTRNLKDWKAYVKKFDQYSRSDLPGQNDYDDVVEKGKISYAEAVTREKAKEQILINERRKLELAKERGELISIEDFNEGQQRQQDALLSVLAKLPDIASGDFVPAEKPAIKKKAKAWISKLRDLVHRELGKK